MAHTVYFLILKTLSIIINIYYKYKYIPYICVYINKPDFCHNGLSFVSVNIHIYARRENFTSLWHTHVHTISIYIYSCSWCWLSLLWLLWLCQLSVSCLNWPNARCNFARILFVSDESSPSSSSGYIYSYIWYRYLYLYLCSMYLYLWNETLSDCRRDCVQLKIACQWRRENFHREITE